MIHITSEIFLSNSCWLQSDTLFGIWPEAATERQQHPARPPSSLVLFLNPGEEGLTCHHRFLWRLDHISANNFHFLESACKPLWRSQSLHAYLGPIWIFMPFTLSQIFMFSLIFSSPGALLNGRCFKKCDTRHLSPKGSDMWWPWHTLWGCVLCRATYKAPRFGNLTISSLLAYSCVMEDHWEPSSTLVVHIQSHTTSWASVRRSEAHCKFGYLDLRLFCLTRFGNVIWTT